MNKKNAVKRKIQNQIPATETRPAADIKPENFFHAPTGFLARLCYVISFVNPFAGVVLGAVFMPQCSQKAKTFGKNCLLIAIAAFLFAIFFLTAVIMSGGWTPSGLSGFIIKEGYF